VGLVIVYLAVLGLRTQEGRELAIACGVRLLKLLTAALEVWVSQQLARQLARQLGPNQRGLGGSESAWGGSESASESTAAERDPIGATSGRLSKIVQIRRLASGL